MHKQFLGDFIVYFHHPSIHDTHVQTGFDGVVQEGRMHCLAHTIVAAEGEADVRNTTRDFGTRQVLLDPACGFNEVYGVVVVFIDACGYGEDVGVKDDVVDRKSNGFEDVITAFANGNFAFETVGLSVFVKGHHYHCSTIAMHQFGFFYEGLFAILQRNGIHDAFAL